MKQIHVFVSNVFFLCTFFCMTSAWDPDAGLVTSFTKTSQARVLASSNPADAAKANDGNDNTQWTSHGCMPAGFYLDNELTNVLYEACQQGRCSSSSSGRVNTLWTLRHRGQFKSSFSGKVNMYMMLFNIWNWVVHIACQSGRYTSSFSCRTDTGELVSRVPDSWSKGCEIEVRQERRGTFLLQSQLCELNLVRCPFYLRVTAVARNDTGHSAQSAGGRLHLNTHTPLTHRSRSGLTMPLSRQSVGIY